MRAWFVIPIVLGLGLLGLYAAEEFQLEGQRTRVAAVKREASQQIRFGGGAKVVGPMTLSGPQGASVRIPDTRPRIVNVWLQACPDCMPRFEASRELVEAGEGWPEAPINVAYGSANAQWAERYGVADELVVDAGSNLVRPLGISTFTTLVIDAEGRVVHTDYVDRAGFSERVRLALAKAGSPASAPEASPEASPSPSSAAVGVPESDLRRPLEDPRILAGMVFLALGVVGAGLTLTLRQTEAGGGPLQPWQEDLVVGGRRCSGCAGRFDEPSEATRCTGCEAPYHRTCAKRAPQCQTQGCGKRIPV